MRNRARTRCREHTFRCTFRTRTRSRCTFVPSHPRAASKIRPCSVPQRAGTCPFRDCTRSRSCSPRRSRRRPCRCPSAERRQKDRSPRLLERHSGRRHRSAELAPSQTRHTSSARIPLPNWAMCTRSGCCRHRSLRNQAHRRMPGARRTADRGSAAHSGGWTGMESGDSQCTMDKTRSSTCWRSRTPLTARTDWSLSQRLTMRPSYECQKHTKCRPGKGR
jgi:hypothetical protein